MGVGILYPCGLLLKPREYGNRFLLELERKSGEIGFFPFPNEWQFLLLRLKWVRKCQCCIFLFLCDGISFDWGHLPRVTRQGRSGENMLIRIIQTFCALHHFLCNKQIWFDLKESRIYFL